MVSRYITIVLAAFCGGALQAQQVFTSVSVNPPEVYVGEPATVKLTVYTSTYFTKPVDFPSGNIEGAYTIPKRRGPASPKINGKTYAAIEFYYSMYPNEVGTITIPSISLTVVTPAEGDYKGKKRTLTTEERTLKVKDIPPGQSRDQWLVANDLRVSERYDKPLKDLKVGDVLQRTVNLNVTGTLSQFIPEMKLAIHTEEIHTYPKSPQLNNNNERGNMSSSRTEQVAYLFQKEGEVTLPEQTFTWYDPVRKKLYSRSLSARTLTIAPNPDLGMLASQRALLEQQQEETEKEETASDGLLWGYSWWQWLLFILIAIVGVALLIRILKEIRVGYKTYRKRYLASEKYYFSKVSKAFRHDNREEMITALYAWLNVLMPHTQQPTLKQFALQIEDLSLEKATDAFMRSLYGAQTSQVSRAEMLTALEKARKQLLYPSHWKDGKQKPSLNPSVVSSPLCR